MGLKAFLLIVLAIFLVITSKVAARELVQRSLTSLEKGAASEVNEAKSLLIPGIFGGGGNILSPILGGLIPGNGGGGGGRLP
ncbi:hypothetical protein KY284_028104 [Solanum tuberosum]|nr:hypothetical protein KY284_028104 [Solanum tuberosum]